jgi:hypothetical protein
MGLEYELKSKFHSIDDINLKSLNYINSNKINEITVIWSEC